MSNWNNSTHAFKYSCPSFLGFFFFFFHCCYRYNWYYLKDCLVILCFKSAEVFTFVKICQNKVLSWEKQLMKCVWIFQVRVFCVTIFLGVVLQGTFDGWEYFGCEFPRNIFLETFSAYNVSILIFPKTISKCYKTFNKKVYTLNS